MTSFPNWRRVQDLNLWGIAPNRFSKPALSTTQPTLQYIRFFKAHIVTASFSRGQLASCPPPRSVSDEKQSSLFFVYLSQPSNIKLPQFLRFFKNIVEYKSWKIILLIKKYLADDFLTLSSNGYLLEWKVNCFAFRPVPSEARKLPLLSLRDRQ